MEGDGDRNVPRYIRRPFRREPDFGVTSVNYDLEELLGRSVRPGEEEGVGKGVIFLTELG